MINRYLIYAAITLAMLCTGKWACAAYTEITDITKITSTDPTGTLRTAVNTKFDNANTMFSELYNSKADKTSLASQSAFTTVYGWTPGGISAWSDVQALISGTGDYIKYDGTRGTPAGSTLTPGTNIGDILEWDGDSYEPSTVLDFTATAPLSFNSTTGIVSLTPWANQDALETWLGWSFSGNGGGITISSDLPTVAGTATLNDTTHVLTVASATGYTQFTGSFTAWPISSLLVQDFNTGSTPSGWSYTGTTSFNATPAIEGAYSMTIPPGSTATTNDFGAAGPVVVDFILNEGALPASGSNIVLQILDASSAALASVKIAYNGRIYLDHGSASTLSAGSVSTGTAYHYWLEYTPGTGSNGLASLYWTAYTGSEVKPGSANVTVSTGTATQVGAKCLFLQSNVASIGGTYDLIEVNNL